MQQSQQSQQPTYFPVSLNFYDDNGLGFGQGSTAGVYNQYAKGGFHRPRMHQPSTQSRKSLNLNECVTPYLCHYDPEKYNVTPEHIELPNIGNAQHNIKNNRLIRSEINASTHTHTIASFIIVIIFLFILSGKYSF